MKLGELIPGMQPGETLLEHVRRTNEGDQRIIDRPIAYRKVPGKWSVYDAQGNLCAGGYHNQGAAEMYAPPSERDRYKFMLEPTSTGDARWEEAQAFLKTLGHELTIDECKRLGELMGAA